MFMSKQKLILSLLVITSVLLIISGCSPSTGEENNNKTDVIGDDVNECEDKDDDTWCVDSDCDDNNGAVYPGAQEIYDPPNGIDDNCNGLTDEANTTGLEDWDMYLTVDNIFHVYFGTPTETTGISEGTGGNWQQSFNFIAEDRKVTDYLYVATASDQLTAQGFIGTFTNLTRNKVTSTGDGVWQVFAAGAHQETNPYWPDPWPAIMPTQAEVNTAIAFAQANDLWVIPSRASGYDNDPSTDIYPYEDEWGTFAGDNYFYDNIPASATWIWYDSGKCNPSVTTGWPAPFHECNHDEFLVFRVAGTATVVY
jgi:Putative metal-binding motif